MATTRKTNQNAIINIPDILPWNIEIQFAVNLENIGVVGKAAGINNIGNVVLHEQDYENVLDVHPIQ